MKNTIFIALGLIAFWASPVAASAFVLDVDDEDVSIDDLIVVDLKNEPNIIDNITLDLGFSTNTPSSTDPIEPPGTTTPTSTDPIEPPGTTTPTSTDPIEDDYAIDLFVNGSGYHFANFASGSVEVTWQPMFNVGTATMPFFSALNSEEPGFVLPDTCTLITVYRGGNKYRQAVDVFGSANADLISQATGENLKKVRIRCSNSITNQSATDSVSIQYSTSTARTIITIDGEEYERWKTKSHLAAARRCKMAELEHPFARVECVWDDITINTPRALVPEPS